MIDKGELLRRLRAGIEEDLRSLSASQEAAQAGAIHEETRQEDPKDTRAIEATYLSRGLAERVESMQETARVFARIRLVEFGPDDEIAATALVGLEEEGGSESVYFIVPSAGGETLTVDDVEVRTVTPGSPLGAALLGATVDDEIEVELPTRRMRAVVGWVR